MENIDNMAGNSLEALSRDNLTNSGKKKAAARNNQRSRSDILRHCRSYLFRDFSDPHYRSRAALHRRLSH